MKDEEIIDNVLFKVLNPEGWDNWEHFTNEVPDKHCNKVTRDEIIDNELTSRNFRKALIMVMKAERKECAEEKKALINEDLKTQELLGDKNTKLLEWKVKYGKLEKKKKELEDSLNKRKKDIVADVFSDDDLINDWLDEQVEEYKKSLIENILETCTRCKDTKELTKKVIGIIKVKGVSK